MLQSWQPADKQTSKSSCGRNVAIKGASINCNPLKGLLDVGYKLPLVQRLLKLGAEQRSRWTTLVLQVVQYGLHKA